MRPLMALLAAWLTTAPAAAGAATETNATPLRVVASFYPMYVAALNLVYDLPGVELQSLAPPQTGCLHDYQFTTADMRLLARAQVLVINGAGMEPPLDGIRRAHPHLAIIDASAGLEARAQAQAGHADCGPHCDHAHAEAGNAHVWLSPSLHAAQVRAMAEGLGRADPGRAETYRERAALYVKALEDLRARIADSTRDLRNRKIITFHEAFPHFAREFGLEVVAVVEPEPGKDPSARELAATIRRARAEKVGALFVEPQYNSKAAETIARETGIPLLSLDPAVTGPRTRDAYLAIMERNRVALVKALR